MPGPVTVKPGATLIAAGVSFGNAITADGAAGVFLTSSTVAGPVKISETTGAVVVVDNKIDGPLLLVDNHTTGGPILVAGNTVNGSVACSDNTPEPVNMEIQNSTQGPSSGQCAEL